MYEAILLTATIHLTVYCKRRILVGPRTVSFYGTPSSTFGSPYNFIWLKIFTYSNLRVEINLHNLLTDLVRVN